MKAIGALVLAGLILAACGRATPWPQASTGQTDPGDSSYRLPPQLRGAARTPDGEVALFGRALPGSAIRMASPSGRALDAVADPRGDWTLKAPADAPEIYALAQETNGRRDRAEGYVAVLPGQGPAAALLRAGAGAQVMADDAMRLAILAADADSSGAVVVSGRAPPGQALRLTVDGALAGEGAAAADGRFAISLPKTLNPGAHAAVVLTASAKAQATLELGPPTAFSGGMRAVQRDWGWRLDWATPGGGVQTTELFVAAEPQS